MARPAASTQGALPESVMGAILRDAALCALVALGLCLPLIAYRMDPGPGSDLVLVPRWGLVAILCAITFGVRLGQRLLLLRRDARRAVTPLPPRPGHRGRGGRARCRAEGLEDRPEAVRGGGALPAGPGDAGHRRSRLGPLLDRPRHPHPHLRDARLGAEHRRGLAGLLDLGYVAFYAVGAYSYALLSTTFGLSFWVCLPLAGLFAGLWGMLLGFPVLRLRGDLPRHRDAGLRRDHPPRPHQLDGRDRRRGGRVLDSAPPSSASPSRRTRTGSPPASASNSIRCTGSCSCTT